MCHALIIDDNLSVRCGVMDQLAEHGFSSFDHTWTERQALAAAIARRPDLIVIGNAIAEGSPFEVAFHIARPAAVPILTVTSAGFRLYRATANHRSSARQPCSSEMREALASWRGISVAGGSQSAELVG